MALAGIFSPRRSILGLLVSFIVIAPLQVRGQGRWVNLTNGDYVKGLAEHDGRMWAATNGGIFGLNEGTGTPLFYTHANSALSTNQPSSVHVEPSGDLWALSGNQLVRFDGFSWTLPAVPFQPRKMLTDNRGTMWIHDSFLTTSRHLAMRSGTHWDVLDAAFDLETANATG